MQQEKCLLAASLFAALAAVPLAAAAQKSGTDYPTKPVRLIVGFTPGASNDIIARLFAAKVGEVFGQQFVVDNRPGAGGAIGAETVARALPDGYTLILSNPGPNVNSPLLARKPTYTPNDFTNIVFIGYAPLAILANPSFPPKNPRELSDYLKINPGKVTWGSSGIGSGLHIGLALFQAATGANVIHVPYKGTAAALTDVVGGQIQLMYTTTVSGGEQITAGKVKVIGVAATKRIPSLPDVQTLAEGGIKDAEAIVWFGISGPPKLPRAIVDKLNREVNRQLRQPDVKARLDQLGLEAEGGTPEAFDKFVKGEIAKVEKLIKAGLPKPE